MKIYNSLYSENCLIVKQYSEDIFQLCYLKRKFNKGISRLKKINASCSYCYYPLSDDLLSPTKIIYNKMSESLSRSKKLIKGLALCNDFEYFFTGTINKEKLNRYDLNKFYEKFSKFIDNYNRIKGTKISYVLVPEQHKDGAWHIHGLISGICDKDLVFNCNSYLIWSQYDSKFGFMSLSKIKDKLKVSSYIAKYITKGLGLSIDKNHRVFYSSKGLKKPEKIIECKNIDKDVINDISWDFIQEKDYCRLKTVSYKELLEILQILTFSSSDDENFRIADSFKSCCINSLNY